MLTWDAVRNAGAGSVDVGTDSLAASGPNFGKIMISQQLGPRGPCVIGGSGLCTRLSMTDPGQKQLHMRIGAHIPPLGC